MWFSQKNNLSLKRRIMSRFWFLGLILGFFPLAGTPDKVWSGEVTLAVASNFTRPIKKIATAFQEKSGHKVRLVFGSSGKIFAQISHGAPFDVFLSADQEKPHSLIQNNLALADSRFSYAIGKLALWAPKRGHAPGPSDLINPAVRKIALANPKLAPYGRAAHQLLQSLKLDETLAPKLVWGENIAQTYQFIASGNADMGFVSQSQLGPDQKGVWIIPADLHDPILQDAVLLNIAQNNSAARDFLTFLQSDDARKIILAHGYHLTEREGLNGTD